MQLALLKDTPVIYSYFYSYIAGTASKVKGYVPDGISVVNLRGVTRLVAARGEPATGPAPPAHPPTPWLRYTLNRIALGLDLPAAAEHDGLRRCAGAAGESGPARPRTRGDPRGGGAFNERLGFDRPLPVRYADWLSDAVRGDFGANYTDGRAVTDDLVPALKRSGLLALYAFVLCVPLSILAGVIAAVRRGKPLDRTITVAGLSLAVIPDFVLGAILVAIFGPAFLDWFPGIAGFLDDQPFLTKLDSLFLPALALALVLFGYIARITRAGTIEALAADYTRTATLKGLPRRRVLGTHVVRNGLLPTIAVVATQVGYMFGGIVAIEKLFGYPGIGLLTLSAAQVKNFPMLLAAVLVIGDHLLRRDADRRPADRRAQPADPTRGREVSDNVPTMPVLVDGPPAAQTPLHHLDSPSRVRRETLRQILRSKTFLLGVARDSLLGRLRDLR